MPTKKEKVDMDRVHEDLDNYFNLTKQAKDLQDEAAGIKDNLVDLLRKTGRRYFESGRGKITMVEPTSLSIDEKKLKRLLTPAEWRSVTRTSIDKKRLEAAITTAGSDSDLARKVAQCSSEERGTVYGRATAK